MTAKSETQGKELNKYKPENTEISQKLQKSETKIVALTHELRKAEANFQKLQEKLKGLSGDKIQYKNSYEIICKMDKGAGNKKSVLGFV
jgi:predicted nuclease with TOPRIM domain